MSGRKTTFYIIIFLGWCTAAILLFLIFSFLNGKVAELILKDRYKLQEHFFNYLNVRFTSAVYTRWCNRSRPISVIISIVFWRWHLSYHLCSIKHTYELRFTSLHRWIRLNCWIGTIFFVTASSLPGEDLPEDFVDRWKGDWSGMYIFYRVIVWIMWKGNFVDFENIAKFMDARAGRIRII